MGPFFELLSQMGLVLPGETTFRTLALMIMVATDGIEKTRALSVEVRLAMVKSVKTLWTKRQKACGLQHESFKIKILPETVAEFKALHGDVYEAVFSSKGFVPAQSPIGPLESAALEDCSRCRETRTPSQLKAETSTTSIALRGGRNPCDPFALQMAMFRQMMNSMVETLATALGQANVGGIRGNRREADEPSITIFQE